MLALVGVPRSTFLGWARAGIVERDEGGAYTEPQVVEVALIAALREHLSIEELALRWPRLHEEGKAAAFVSLAREVDAPDDQYVLVIAVRTGAIDVATDANELADAVLRKGGAHTVVVIDIADEVRQLREGFVHWSVTTSRPKERKVGRPAARRPATVTELRRGS